MPRSSAYMTDRAVPWSTGAASWRTRMFRLSCTYGMTRLRRLAGLSSPPFPFSLSPCGVA